MLNQYQQLQSKKKKTESKTMAEILEETTEKVSAKTLGTSESKAPIPKFNPDTMRTTKPGLKRLLITLAVLSSFLFGLPFLLKSIEIYRSPLPFSAIDSLSNHLVANPIHLPCRFQALIVGFGANGENQLKKLGFSISNEMEKLIGNDQICGGCGKNYSVSVSDENIDFSGVHDDEGVDELLLKRLDGGSDVGGKVYTVVVVKRDVERRVVVGKYRHGWIVGNVEVGDAVTMIARVFVKVFMNGGKEEELVHGEFMPVGADGRVVLSFSLLNSDPQDWIYDWDFQKLDEAFLTPVIESLAAVANMSVESQVLYHTPKSSFSYWDDKLSSNVFSTKDLPFFVNSNEWHLDTSVAAGGRSKILQFVVYIPSVDECPLLLQLPNGEISMSNGFISPMWGGVAVWNSPSCFRNSNDRHPARHTFSPEDLQNVFEVFVGQLRQLFGLNSDNHLAAQLGVSSFLPTERGFAEWELDVLARHHTCFNLISCGTSLGSLSKLVQSLPRMIIKDEIGKQVKFSLEAAHLAQSNASLGIYDASTVSSRQARSLAEDAFFHPSIMSISYYSFEHSFAIYTPFFLPVSLHILLAAVKELRRYKKESAKYYAWAATSKTQ